MIMQPEAMHFDLSEYMVLQPKCNDRDKKTIYIMANNELRLSSSLMKEFDLSTYHYATVLLHKNENRLAFMVTAEQTDQSVYLKKNSCSLLKDAVAQLKSRGIKAPACFVVENKADENIWLATYDASHHFPEVRTSANKLNKPRKRIPKEVLA